VAGRNVGSIEVTVDANTSKLRAKLVKDATSAGRQAANALERELRDIDAELSLNSTSARAELRKFQEAANRIGAEIELGLSDKSKSELKAQLAAIDEQIDDIDAVVGIELSPGARSQLEAQLKELQKTAEQFSEIKLQASLTGQANINAALKQIEEQVRTIEFRLDADPAALQAKLAELSSKKEDIEFQLRIDEKSRAIMEAQLQRIGIEDRTIEMRAILDEKQALAQLRALQNVQIDLGLSTDQATALYESWKERLEAQKVEARITGDFTDFNLSIRELKAKLALEQFEAKIDADVAGALASVQILEEAIANDDFSIPVDADLTKARAAITLFREIQQHNDIELPVDIDVDALDAALARMEATAAAGGDKAGSAFGTSFGGGANKGFSLIPGQIAQWAPLIGIALGPAVQVLEGALGGAIQVVSSAFSALGGAAGAAAPIVAGLGAVMGAVVIGSLGMGKAIKASSEAFTEMEDTGTVSEATLKKVDKAMRQLTPAARGVAQEIAAMLPQFRDLQNIVSSHLFAGMGAELHALSAETIPDIAASLVLAGDSANRFGKQMLDAIRGIDFTGTFAAIQPAIDSLGRAIANVVRAIEPFLKAAAPAARELASWIEDASKSFLNMVRAGAGSGAITKFLLEGVESLKDWARLVGAVGDALFTLFQAGKSGGDGMVKSLTDIVNKFDAWMESAKGQRALTDFFATSRQLLSDLVPLFKGVADGIGSIVSPAAGGSFRQLTTGLGDVARVAGELINVFNRMNITGTVVSAFAAFARALEPIIPALDQVADAIAINLASAVRLLNPLISGLASVIGFVADAFNSLSGPVQTVVLVLGTLIALGPKIGSGLSSIGTAFTSLKTNIDLIPTSAGLARLALSEIGTGIKNLDFSAIGAGVKNLGESVSQLAKGVGAASGVAMASALGIAFGIQLAVESDNIAGKIQGIGTIIASTFAAFAAGGPILAGISLALGGVTALFQASANEAKKAKAEVDEYVNAIGGIGPAFNKINFVKEVLTNLQDEQESTRQGFLKMGVSIGDWAANLANGGNAASAMITMLDKIGPAGQEVAKGLKDGSVSALDFNNVLQIVAAGGTGTNEALGLTTENMHAMIDAFGAAGVSGDQVVEMFDFLSDEGSETSKAMAELVLRNKEAGSALEDLSNNGDKAADGLDATADASAKAAEQLVKLNTELSNADGKAKATAEGFDSITDAVFGIAGPMSTVERSMAGVGKAADAAAEASDAMGKALDTLISPALDAEGALSGYRAAVDDLATSLKDNGTSLDLNTEKGRANREQIRTNIEAIEAYGKAAIAGGDDQAHVTQSMEDMRAELVNQVAAFTGSTEAAEAYVNQLGLTPENISTVVNTPGLLEASQTILSYDNDLDGIDDRVDTEFSATNLEVVKSKLAEYGVDLSGIPDDVLTKFLQENWQAVHDAATGLATDAQTVTDTPAVVTATSEGFPGVTDQIAGVANGMFGIDSTPATATVNAEGIEQTNTGIEGVDSNMKDLDGKTAKPQVELTNNLIVLAVIATIADQVKKLGAMKAAPDVTVPNFGLVVGQTAVMIALLNSLNTTTAKPQVSVPGYGTVAGQLAALLALVITLDNSSASVSVSTPGLSTAINDFRTLQNLLNSINGKVVTTTTKNITQNITQTIGGGMAGMMINGPQTLNVGERGLREALIPLDLPLSRVDPSVRAMAEALRGGGGGVPAAGSIGRQVNVYNSIEVNSTSADPVAVATQVVNRAAAMAN
jgi:hypothetical protein